MKRFLLLFLCPVQLWAGGIVPKPAGSSVTVDTASVTNALAGATLPAVNLTNAFGYAHGVLVTGPTMIPSGGSLLNVAVPVCSKFTVRLSGPVAAITGGYIAVALFMQMNTEVTNYHYYANARYQANYSDASGGYYSGINSAWIRIGTLSLNTLGTNCGGYTVTVENPQSTNTAKRISYTGFHTLGTPGVGAESIFGSGECQLTNAPVTNLVFTLAVAGVTNGQWNPNQMVNTEAYIP